MKSKNPLNIHKKKDPALGTCAFQRGGSFFWSTSLMFGVIRDVLCCRCRGVAHSSILWICCSDTEASCVADGGTQSV